MNTLAHLPGLKVTARTSAFAFRGKEQDIRKIAEVLNVRTILEGSVRRSGNRIRVTAQLINAEDGYHLWSERYDREMADVFAMQDEIAASIAAALEVKLVGGAARRRHQPNLQAYEAVLRAEHEQHESTPEANARAKQLVERAIALDPAYSAPHAQLGLYYFLQANWGLMRASEMMPAARAHAQKALDLDPDDARGHGTQCVVASLYEYDWEEAGKQFRLALAAEHVPPDVRAGLARVYLLPVGRVQDAIEQIERALEPDPLNVFARGLLALTLTAGDMHDRALAEAQKGVEMEPSHWFPHFSMSLSYALRGELAAARTAAERSVRAAPWNAQPLGLLAGILAQMGERERADELLGRLRKMPGVGLLLYHLLFSGNDTTADWFAKMVEDRDPNAPVFSCLKPLRSNPRWPALAKMMNLPVEAI